MVAPDADRAKAGVYSTCDVVRRVIANHPPALEPRAGALGRDREDPGIGLPDPDRAGDAAVVDRTVDARVREFGGLLDDIPVRHHSHPPTRRTQSRQPFEYLGIHRG